MSLYDVSKLAATSPVRGVGRDFSGARAEAKKAPEAAEADKGIAVQTGSRAEAGNAPVDSKRVAEIREAIREGQYPITPAKISDALIAARIMLSEGQ